MARELTSLLVVLSSKLSSVKNFKCIRSMRRSPGEVESDITRLMYKWKSNFKSSLYIIYVILYTCIVKVHELVQDVVEGRTCFDFQIECPQHQYFLASLDFKPFGGWPNQRRQYGHHHILFLCFSSTYPSSSRGQSVCGNGWPHDQKKRGASVLFGVACGYSSWKLALPFWAYE